MRTNEGVIDRIVRLIIAAGLISLVFFGPRTPWGWIGLVPLASALAGYCPLYRVIGVNTKKSAAK